MSDDIDPNNWHWKPTVPELTNYVVPGAISFAGQMMAAQQLNAQIRQSGVSLGWQRSHACPCTMGTDIPGSANPVCNTCHGRGRWWDEAIPFVGLLTQKTDPGTKRSRRYGTVRSAYPTLTIPSDAVDVWSTASLLDQYVELDNVMRFETVLQVGGVEVLPYWHEVEVLSVTTYDRAAGVIVPLDAGSWRESGGQVTLIGFQNGTPFTVSYRASPSWIAWSPAGALPHARPYGDGAALPTRFKLMWLDVWLRRRG